MAISKRTGRYYESRRDRGYVPDKRRKKRERYPKGFDRWGDPNTCGVVDEATGEECPKTVIRGGARCGYHQELHDQQFGHPEKFRLFQDSHRGKWGSEMSSVSKSTGAEQSQDDSGRKPRKPYWWPKSRYIPALIPNELASTERYWAIKPPPGMESEPFTPENVERGLGEFNG